MEINPKITPIKGDVGRDIVNEEDITSAFIGPRLSQDNKQNGISRIKTPAGKKDPWGRYFEGVRAKRLPAAGNSNIAASRVFRNRAKYGG